VSKHLNGYGAEFSENITASFILNIIVNIQGYEYLKLPPQAAVLKSKTLPLKPHNVRRTLPLLSTSSDRMMDLCGLWRGLGVSTSVCNDI
jgi:hypothetical protein